MVSRRILNAALAASCIFIPLVAQAQSPDSLRMRASLSNFEAAKSHTSRKSPRYWFSRIEQSEPAAYEAQVREWTIKAHGGTLEFKKRNPSRAKVRAFSARIELDQAALLYGGKVFSTAVSLVGINRQLERNARHKDILIREALPGASLQLAFQRNGELLERWSIVGSENRELFELRLKDAQYFKLKTDGSLAIVLENGELHKSRPTCFAARDNSERPIVCRFLPTGMHSFTVVTPLELESEERFIIQSALSFH